MIWKKEKENKKENKKEKEKERNSNQNFQGLQVIFQVEQSKKHLVKSFFLKFSFQKGHSF